MTKNVAVYTLTRDRVEYTRRAFDSLWTKGGVPFKHCVFDNGSTDETLEYLATEYRPWSLMRSAVNRGISHASNQCVERILSQYPEVQYIVKMDNDCRVVSENCISQVIECLDATGPLSPGFVLSPRVEGIVRQPNRGRETQLAGRRIGLTAIVGGLCHVVPAKVYRMYLEAGGFPRDLPLAKGQDDHFCKWVKQQGGEVGYVEDLIVEHIDGTDAQALKYPDYFRRKWDEEEKVQ